MTDGPRPGTPSPDVPESLPAGPATHPSSAPLAIHDMTVAYHRRPVLWDIDYDAPPGQLTAIVGPNGSGKTTLIKAAVDLVPRASGDVRFFGSAYHKVRHRVGYVPQRGSVDWDFPVNALDVVAMGLYKQIGWLRPVTRRYRDKAMHYLERVGMADYAKRRVVFLTRRPGYTVDLHQIIRTKEKYRVGFHTKFHCPHPPVPYLRYPNPVKPLPWFLFYRILLADEGTDDR